jgi:hypothetical protein
VHPHLPSVILLSGGYAPLDSTATQFDMANDIVMFDTQRYAGHAAAFSDWQAMQQASIHWCCIPFQKVSVSIIRLVCRHMAVKVAQVHCVPAASSQEQACQTLPCVLILNSQPGVPPLLLPAHSCSTERLVPRIGSVLPPGRAYHSMTILGDRVYVFGKTHVYSHRAE